MNPCLNFGFSVLLLSLVSISVFGDELLLQDGVDGYSGTSDNSIYADRPDNTNGGGAYLYSGSTLSSERRALIRFDLSALPENAVIQVVELRLTLDQSGSGAREGDLYALHRLTRSWGEGVVDAGEPGGNGKAAQAGDVTWSAARHPQDAWQTPGGDYAPSPSAPAALSDVEGSEAVFSTLEMIADVQDWLENPDGNFGWILLGASGQRNSRRFVSSEGEPARRPRLTIEYTTGTNLGRWSLY
jgi:hypothetical protein